MLEEILRGKPSCKGKVEGIAKIILDPVSDAIKFNEGDILVVKNTNDTYTPLMYLSSAIVGEVRSILSHLAIVGREAGIPTSIGVKKATKIIKDGDYLIVDAYKGVIYRRNDKDI